MNKLHIKISMKGVLENRGCPGLGMVKTRDMLDAMSSQFGYSMRPNEWHKVKFPTASLLNRKKHAIHPERKVDEFFVGNFKLSDDFTVPDNLSHFKTLRPGSLAFDSNGKRMEYYHMIRPLFIHKSEFGEFHRLNSEAKSVH